MDVAEDAAAGGVDDVVVGVDEAGMDDGAFGVDRLAGVVFRAQLGVGADLDNARAGDGHGAGGVDGAGGVHGDYLPVADE